MQSQQRHFRGWCGIPINSDLSDNPDAEPVALSRMQSLLDETAASLNRGLPGRETPSYFDEEFDLDLENEQYEKIETPDFTKGRRGRFVHDFGKVCLPCHSTLLDQDAFIAVPLERNTDSSFKCDLSFFRFH